MAVSENRRTNVSAEGKTTTGTEKKPKRHMKKQVRRTIAGLFMASAIVVAAIPVQGIQASTEKVNDPANPDTRGAMPAYDATGKDLTLDFSAELTPGTKTKYKSYSTRQLSDGTWSWSWMFEYYLEQIATGTPPYPQYGIISQYNSIYPEENITVSNRAYTDYYTLTPAQFDAFYNDANLGGKTFTITYNNWKSVKHEAGTNENVSWFQQYNSDQYNEFDTLCEDFYGRWNDWKARHDVWAAEEPAYTTWVNNKNAYAASHTPDELATWLTLNPAPPMTYDTEPIEPTDIPADISCVPRTSFSDDKKKSFICDFVHDKYADPAYSTALASYGPLPGSGYTLVSVADNVNTYTDPSITHYIFMAKGGTPAGDACNDNNDFLVKTASKEIIGIAACTYDSSGTATGSFANISNVKTLTLPAEIKYIGDGAFEHSFVESVTFENVENIGNRAFKDCPQLQTISLSGTKKIGAEAFENCDKLTSVTFPWSVDTIGYGAFANNDKMTDVNLNAVTTECKIYPYAFYNDYGLNNVDMKESTGVKDIGDCAFAIESAPTGSFKRAELPNQITGGTGNALGNFLFAGRNNLEYVKFPTNYGNSNTVTVPNGMFKGCTGLAEVDFTSGQGSTICGNANFEYNGTSFVNSNLFRDVLNPDFFVRGPEKNNAGVKAYPRQSTWKAFTSASDYVPYVYIDSTGKECYEVSDGTYLLQANENGELVSCQLVDTTSTDPIDLVIPKTVGDYEVKTIADGCFDDTTLRNRIRSITIEDNSLTGLDANVFKGLPNCEWVSIGNAVSSIGENAFADCNKLENVYFSTPLVGYDGFTIGKDAFKTGSGALTFHGDIAENYAPFTFATGKDTGKIDDNGKRVCYKTNSPTFLTCMYDNKTDEVVLLDYPKYNELDTRNAKHNDQMESFYYDSCGSSPAYDNDRDTFYDAWIRAHNGDTTADVVANSAESKDNAFYGPWLNSTSFDAYWTAHSSDPDYTGFTKPAAPTDYFTKFPYSILDNFENPGSADYQIPTDEELSWINSCLYIDVPNGITSIDAPGFFGASENTRNVATYFGTGSEGKKSRDMCTNTTTDVDGETTVPGLFSGYYQDYTDTPPSTNEQEVRGNDRILSVSLASVKSLPDYCFDSCERLQQVNLGPNLSEMGKAPFRGCDEIANIIGNDSFVEDNKILYTAKDDGTYSVKECLPSRNGQINTANDPMVPKISEMEEGAFEDCDGVTRVDLTDATNLKTIPKNAFKNCDNLQFVALPYSVNKINEDAFTGDTTPIEVKIPGEEVEIATAAFDHDPRNTIYTTPDSAARRYAEYYGLGYEEIPETYTVRFVNSPYASVDPNTVLGEYTGLVAGANLTAEAEELKEKYNVYKWSSDAYKNVSGGDPVIIIQAIYSDSMITVTFQDDLDETWEKVVEVKYGGKIFAPQPPTHAGYTFMKWSPSSRDFDYENVTKEAVITALYVPNNNGGGGGGGGSSEATPTPTGGNGGGSSSSATATPKPGSGSEDNTKKYTVTVSGGSGTGTYAAGAIVPINAYDMGSGQTFDKWTTSTAGVGFANATSPSTYFVMPANNVAVTATYKAGGSGSATSSGSGNGSSSTKSGTANPGGSTTVDITKSGISNRNVAGATVSGSTDNFIVKITDDQYAADMALQALQNAFGDITRIKYLPMDISLYDSTGRTKITDTQGLAVGITMPLPDDLATYAGNNMIASVENGVLDNLNSRFTTVNGVPCISFTATHFSPYVIYVDTANLTESTIDYTPKTGDPIHPKWFLSIGLAAVAVVMFFKKDRKVKVTPA
ncbi:MAG: leucine-rich repeat protein [Lachnospiraceae bacterium]|nr:leucine-rich repeat protein [Lachnospiraceae bacterium]